MRYGLGLKLGVPLLLTLTLGFSLLLGYSLSQQRRNLDEQAEKRAAAVAMAFAANLRNVMLTGDGLLLDRLMSDIRALPNIQELRLFDPAGREIYPKPDRRLAEENLRAHARLALEQAARTGTAGAAAATRREGDGAWRSLHVLPNEFACRPCHPVGPTRGALFLRTHGEAGNAAETVTQSVALGIRQAMLSQRASSVPGIVADLEGAPGLAGIEVYDAGGELRFQTNAAPPTPGTKRAVQAALRSRTDARWAERSASGVERAALTVLANDRLCHACHPAGDALRGVVVARLRAESTPEVQGRRENDVLAASLVANLRNIMLSGKGSAVQRYLDQFRGLPGVERLHVFDWVGREVYPAALRRRPAPAPPQVTEALRTGSATSYYEGERDPGTKAVERARVLLHLLPNEAQCQRCHEDRSEPYRGVILTAVSLKDIDKEVRASASQALTGFAVTMLITCGVLLGVLAGMVLRPIRIIGSVAERVGEGDLDVRAPLRSHDEIGALATRINGMIDGLRAKRHMERFVPPSAVALIEQSRASDRIALGGERRELTILFCDIRGFTTFSEQAEPEEVIRHVNRHLEDQERLVRRHGGEVYKYLGDGIMAVFEGSTMAHDAARCALAIRASLEDDQRPTTNDQRPTTALEPADTSESHGVDSPPVRSSLVVGRWSGERSEPGQTVGIGINTGPVVRGTVGSQDQMELTAMGDTVNVAKRLCDLAAPGEILVSAATFTLVADALAAEARPPLVVKGRRQPVSAYCLVGENPDRRD
jgi:adenylate cyclase